MTELIASEAPKRTGRYGKGHVKDPHDPNLRMTRQLFGARSGVILSEASLEEFVPLIVDQKQTSSCVGQAIGGAIDCRVRKLGRVNAPLVSRQAVYTIARDLGRIAKTEPIMDNGSQASLAMQGLKQWGIPTADRFPFDPDNINEDLPWDVMEAASAYTIDAWWGINSSGKTAIEEMCQALANGFPVVFALQVDQAFEDYSGGPNAFGAIDPNNLLGGHMLHAVGYKTVNGERWLRIVNSWGTTWADSGFAWCREAFFDQAMDRYVIQAG